MIVYFQLLISCKWDVGKNRIFSYKKVDGNYSPIFYKNLPTTFKYRMCSKELNSSESFDIKYTNYCN